MVVPSRDRYLSSDPQFLLLRTDDGSLSLEEVATGNSFHSGCGAVAECLTVYAENSGVAAGLAAGKRQRVLELGFGTGLAFLVTASLAKHSGTALEYVALEQRPLSLDVMVAVLTGAKTIHPVDDGFTDDCIGAFQQVGGFAGGRTTVLQWAGIAKLTVFGCDVRNWDVRNWNGVNDYAFDAIYFDPFDPATNSELWTTKVFEQMYQLLVPGGRLTSYCVKSDVRRALLAIGFKITKLPGPIGGKREVLVAERPTEDG